MKDVQNAALNLHHAEILKISQKSRVHLAIAAVKPIGISWNCTLAQNLRTV